MKDLRHSVFWPSFSLLIIAVISSVLFKGDFLELAGSLNNFILKYFGLGFSIVVLIMLVICVAIPFSKLGSIKIGGEDAEPFLTKPKWFAIVLCTTIATGILFWGTAEPMFHYLYPPDINGIKPESADAARFSLSTLFLHWSFSPYAIYTIPALMFAIAYYNKEQSFSLGSTLFAIMGNKKRRLFGFAIDNISLFSLVMGMSASLGAGILTLRGGIEKLINPAISDEVLTIIIALIIILTFTASAATGLLKGIKNLSFINLYVFIFLLVFVAFSGYLGGFSFFIPAMKTYITDLFSGSLNILRDESWSNSWTTFYWANWMAWAPITALFLGRLAYGRTVREFMIVNWILPSIFAIIWMTIFGGNVLFIEMEGIFDFKQLLESQGPESIIYGLFNLLPFSPIIIAAFLFTTYISYVTAADSNTEALGGISSLGISPEKPSPDVKIKVLWGTIIGATAITAINYAGIDGIKMLSDVGGLPSLFLIILIIISLLKYWKNEGI